MSSVCVCGGGGGGRYFFFFLIWDLNFFLLTKLSGALRLSCTQWVVVFSLHSKFLYDYESTAHNELIHLLVFTKQTKSLHSFLQLWTQDLSSLYLMFVDHSMGRLHFQLRRPIKSQAKWSSIHHTHRFTLEEGKNEVEGTVEFNKMQKQNSWQQVKHGKLTWPT